MPEENQQAQERERYFGVIAEAEGYGKQLVLLNLPFGRLMDDIVVPYESDQPFFIDGVPVTKQKIKRIKIVELGEDYYYRIAELDRGMNHGEASSKKAYGEQCQTRFEHILRTTTVDVTAQVIKAYSEVIKPSIKNYLPKREELIGAAAQFFMAAVKSLGN